MANTLTLLSIEKDGVVRVASAGDVTAADARPSERNPFEAVLGAGWASNRVLLDLSKTGYIDSAGIGWLIASNKEFKSRGGALAVHSVSTRVRQVLELLKVERVMPLLADEAAARELIKRQAQ